MLIKHMKFWVRNEEGVTAVEFSLMAVPFVLMMIGIIEMALMFSAASLLEASTAKAARLIKTGQLQQSGSSETMFRDALCDRAEIFIPCNRIQYEVTTIPNNDFEEAENFGAPEFDEDGDLLAAGFNPGGVDDVIIVRVIYRYPIITPMIQPILANGPGNTHLLMSTAVFKNEPYEFVDD